VRCAGVRLLTRNSSPGPTVAYKAVAVRCTVRYGMVRTVFTACLKIGTVFTVRYGMVYGTVCFFAG